MEFDKLTDSNLIGIYRAIRERKEEAQERHQAELKPFAENMKLIESELLRRMDERGANSTKTDHGTAYKTIGSSVRVANSGAFFDWLRRSDRWECADIRAAKKEVESYMEENQSLPPGLDITRIVKCGIRKPTGIK